MSKKQEDNIEQIVSENETGEVKEEKPSKAKPSTKKPSILPEYEKRLDYSLKSYVKRDLRINRSPANNLNFRMTRFAKDFDLSIKDAINIFEEYYMANIEEYGKKFKTVCQKHFENVKKINKIK